MVQSLLAFQGQDPPGKKPFQHRPDFGRAGGPGPIKREGIGRFIQCPVALRGGAQNRSEGRTRKGQSGGSKKKDRTPETEPEKLADTAAAIAERQEAGQERSAAKRSAKERPREEAGPTRPEGPTAVPKERGQRQKRGTESGRDAFAFPGWRTAETATE